MSSTQTSRATMGQRVHLKPGSTWDLWNPKRKGGRNQQLELQQKFDELEALGVFRHPEDIDISVEYLNLPFLVKKTTGGSRLVTAFADVGHYNKPQPSLIPDVDYAISPSGSTSSQQI